MWDEGDQGDSKFGSRDNLMKIQKRKEEVEASREERSRRQPPSVLQRIHLRVESGSLVCLIGRGGSGKTALLHAILGEMVMVDGSVTVLGELSYAAQSAFILNSTGMYAQPPLPVRYAVHLQRVSYREGCRHAVDSQRKYPVWFSLRRAALL